MRENKISKIKNQKLFNAHRLFLILFFLILNSQVLILNSTYASGNVVREKFQETEV